ncbi:MAG: DUF3572 domain-containing protein [Hyphomicrobiaceae bacterium]
MKSRLKSTPLTAEEALDIASRALLFVAEDTNRLQRFMGETGLDPQTLRQNAGSREVLCAALGHVMEDESTALTFAANAGLRPERLAEARSALGLDGQWDSV